MAEMIRIRIAVAPTGPIVLGTVLTFNKLLSLQYYVKAQKVERTNRNGGVRGLQSKKNKQVLYNEP